MRTFRVRTLVAKNVGGRGIPPLTRIACVQDDLEVIRDQRVRASMAVNAHLDAWSRGRRRGSCSIHRARA